MNTINLIGRLTKDAELVVLPNGTTNILKFAIAVERDYKGKDGKKPVDFINCEYVMNSDLSKLAVYIKKGNQIAVMGSLNIDKVNDTYYTKVKVNKVTLLSSAKATETVEDDDTPF